MKITDEFGTVDLGDPRRERRLFTMVERFAAGPSKSVAAAMRSPAEREAAYRLLSNDAVEMNEILEPHLVATARRAKQATRVIVAHDTTEVGFSTPRLGLGRINDDEMGRGFFAHTALVVSAEGRRDPLGVLGLQTYVRMTPPGPKRERHTERVAEREKESARWWEMVAAVTPRLEGVEHTIHVMDREADNYVLFARLIDGGSHFVIRLRHDRLIELEGEKEPTLRKALASLSGCVRRQVTLGPREPKPLAKPSVPPNRVRTATLEFRATRVVVRRPRPVPKSDLELPETIELNVVHVTEVDPPDGYEPIDWKLATTEPVVTPQDVEAIVDAYDTRWVIEEFFKSLKTGCALEKRELENDRAIYNLLAMLVPIAWRLLRLRTLARHASDSEPASSVLTKLQIAILQVHEDVRMTRDNPTVRDAYLAIARLGGHIKNNGSPGWQVLGRGLLELITLARGAALARGMNDDYL